MSKVEIDLSSHILREYFGPVVAGVAASILKKGDLPLKFIVNEFDECYDPEQVKKAICILLHFNLAKCKQSSSKSPVLYRVSTAAVISVLRYPRIIYAAKALYEDSAELLVEELLQSGRKPMSKLVSSVTARLKTALNGSSDINTSKVRDAFKMLAETHFVRRLPPNLSKDDEEFERIAYTVPDVYIPDPGSEASSEEPAAKKRKLNSGQDDSAIHWAVNTERFAQYLRDQAIVSAVSRRISKVGGEVVRTMLRQAEVMCSAGARQTSPTSIHDILRLMPAELDLTRVSLQQHLSLLIDDEFQPVSKVDESGGGMYVVNVETIISNLCKAHLESVVQERFGGKSLRLFRLLLLKQHMEQKQIEQDSLLPAKECKDRLFRLLQNGFVSLTELSKSADHAPARTLYLFRVCLLPLSQQMLQNTYRTAANLLARIAHEQQENKRLLEKWARIEAISASLKAQGNESQVEEITSLMTPAETQQLSKVNQALKKLQLALLQLDSTMLIFELYLDYHSVRSPL